MHPVIIFFVVEIKSKRGKECKEKKEQKSALTYGSVSCIIIEYQKPWCYWRNFEAFSSRRRLSSTFKFERLKIFINSAKESFKNIRANLICKREIKRTETKKLVAYTIPRTCKYHNVIPISQSIIACEVSSCDNETAIKYDITSKKSFKWTPNSYVLVVNLNKWCTGYNNNNEVKYLEA